MEKAFKDLHRGALAMSTHLLAQATESQLEAIEDAVDRGAYLSIQVGPLPDPEAVALIVVWPDGHRVVACHTTIKREALQ